MVWLGGNKKNVKNDLKWMSWHVVKRSGVKIMVSLYWKGNDRETETEKLNRREEKLWREERDQGAFQAADWCRKGVEGAESLGTWLGVGNWELLPAPKWTTHNPKVLNKVQIQENSNYCGSSLKREYQRKYRVEKWLILNKEKLKIKSKKIKEIILVLDKDYMHSKTYK